MKSISIFFFGGLFFMLLQYTERDLRHKDKSEYVAPAYLYMPDTTQFYQTQRFLDSLANKEKGDGE